MHTRLEVPGGYVEPVCLCVERGAVRGGQQCRVEEERRPVVELASRALLSPVRFDLRRERGREGGC